MGGLDGLIERDEELAALRSAIAAASAGRGRLVVGSAAAGLGKSSLLEAARTLSTEAGLWPLAARGSELERDYPFGAVRQLLDPVLLSHVVGDDARREAVHLAAPLADGTGQEGAADPGYARLHGIYWLLANLAQERPVLVTVDDAHWLDRASLRFLCFLARRLEGLPLLLLVALRPNEALADETLLPELTQRPDALLRPQPLSIDGVAALVGNRLGTMPDSMFARACAATTGGNLFYVRALLGELAERGVSPVAANADLVRGLCPRDVSRYLLRRLATLPPEATAVARAVAVLGDDADTGRIAHLAGLDQRRLADAAHALGSVAIFAQSDRLAFAHPIARTAVYGAIPLAERAEAHGRATRLLLGSGAAPEQVAAQLMGVEAGSQPEAFRVLRRAAASALARGAAEAAATYLRRALDEPLDDAERGPLLAELGRREAQAGLPESGAHLREALARTDLASHARADAAVALARVLIAHGKGPEAAQLLTAQADALAAHPRLAARLDAELLAIANIDLGVRPVVDGRARWLEDTSVADEPLARALDSYRAVDATLSGSSAHAATTWAERALSGGSLLAEAMTGGQNFVYMMVCLIAAERFELAGAQLDAALEQARANGSAAPFVILCAARGMLGFRTGALGDAEADLRIGLEAARLNGYQPLELIMLAGLADVLGETGEAGEVAARLAAGWVDEAAAATPQGNTALEARGRLRLALGNADAGVADLLVTGDRFLWWGLRNPSLYRWRSSLALGLAALGETDRAVALAREELELARTWGTPRAIGIALRAVGLLERRPRQLELLEDAAAVLEGSGAALERARVLTELGAAQRRAGRRADARGTLRRALDVAVGCGATVLADRTRTELRSAGGRPRTTPCVGVAALTASERRIAGLAASGASNPAIARSLSITVKTVEMHLSSAYRKLGVRSRSELPQALHDPGRP